MRKYILAGLILPFLLCCIVSPVCAGINNTGTSTDQSPYDRLISVEKWKVNLHLVYDYKKDSNDGYSVTEHTVSDWTGTLDSHRNIIGRWWSDLDVAIDGVREVYSTCRKTTVAKGSEKYSFGLDMDKDGYTIGQGYCNTTFGTETYRCPKEGVKTSKASLNYSVPWKVKLPLPARGTTLSGSDRFTHDKPSADDYVPEKGLTITVKWELTPVRERELKYRETALDVAAMNYPGKAVDPHVFIVEVGGGTSWIPHANFAGEVWVDGTNKVKIRTGTGPGPRGVGGRAQNVTSEYMIFREVRSWDMNHNRKLDWTPDSPDPIQDWIDNAGVDLAAGPPPTWNKRVMDEFLVQVVGHPEIGRVYVAFAMETRKNAYRIRYSDSIFLTEEEYKKIKASPTPFFPYPFTNKDDGWVELVQDPKTKEWKTKASAP
jgi:hypothetical protein